MSLMRIAVAAAAVWLAGSSVVSDVRAASFALGTTVTTDGVLSSAGGSLSIACRAAGGSTWTSCGSSVASGTSVWIWAAANEGYWFMWYGTSPYLQGCTTMNWGWGYGPNPMTQCAFTMPSQNVSINAEFQLP